MRPLGCCCFLLSGSVERSENKRLLGRTMPPRKGRVFPPPVFREEEGTQGKREDGSLNLSLPRNPCLSRLNDAAGGREKTNKNCGRWFSRGSLNSARKPSQETARAHLWKIEKYQEIEELQ